MFVRPRQYPPGQLSEPAGGGVATALRRERIRIARELHDQVVQELILAVVALRGLAPPNSPDADASSLAEASAAASRALSKARRFLADLRALEYERDGPEPQVCLADIVLPIMAMAESTARVEVQTPVLKSVRLSARAAREVGMIVREAVVNATRHARARVIACTAVSKRGRLSLEVADDGCGFEPSEGVHGFGLLGMAERARVLGATLEVRSRPGCGTVVQLHLAQAPAVAG
jgi:signal transduction histidine kinase